jgi:hypothetical protein
MEVPQDKDSINALIEIASVDAADFLIYQHSNLV